MANQKGYSSCKIGLGLITLSITLTILMGIVMAICYLIPNRPAVIDKIDAIVLLVAGVASLLGILICLFSGQKHFTFALVMYIAIIVILIVLVALNKSVANWVYGLFYIMIALGHLSIILGLKDLYTANRKFNNSMITICLFLFTVIVVFVFLLSFGILNTKFIGLVKFLDVCESIFFLLAIVSTYKALR